MAYTDHSERGQGIFGFMWNSKDMDKKLFGISKTFNIISSESMWFWMDFKATGQLENLEKLVASAPAIQPINYTFDKLMIDISYIAVGLFYLKLMNKDAEDQPNMDSSL